MPVMVQMSRFPIRADVPKATGNQRGTPRSAGFAYRQTPECTNTASASDPSTAMTRKTLRSYRSCQNPSATMPSTRMTMKRSMLSLHSSTMEAASREKAALPEKTGIGNV